MKLFRKIKYKLRRFIISLLSVLCLFSVFIFSASADVLPVTDVGYSLFVQPFYVNGSQYVYSQEFMFQPGIELDSNINVTAGQSFGLLFRCVNDEGQTYNGFNVTTGVLHISVSFISNIYFTSTTPVFTFGRWQYDSDYGEESLIPVMLDSRFVTYNTSTTLYDGSGSSRRWLVTTDILIDSKYLPYRDFAQFSFNLRRESSPDTKHWYFIPQEFIIEALTGADVPKYSAPDSSAKDVLDDTEGQLNDTIDSYSGSLTDAFNLLGLNNLFASVRWWGSFVLSTFFELPFFDGLLKLSLAIGLFSLLFGLFGSVVTAYSRSRRASSEKNKSGKGKGG